MAAQDEVDVCESWEDMDEMGLDKKINNFMSAQSPSVGPSTVNGCTVKILVDDNASLGSQFMMQEPSIRILKRPTAGVNGVNGNETKARPVKPLEQRQKEYEEARLRILGEARSPEDILDENLTRLEEKLQANSLAETITKVKERPQLERVNAGITPRSAPPGVLILRSPRGPDGTRGFAQRR